MAQILAIGSIILSVIYLASQLIVKQDHTSIKQQGLPTVKSILGTLLVIFVIELWLCMGFIAQTLLILKIGYHTPHFHSSIDHILNQLSTKHLMQISPLFPGLFIAALILLMRQARQRFQQSDFLVPTNSPYKTNLPTLHVRILRRLIQIITLCFIVTALNLIAIAIIQLLTPHNRLFNNIHLNYIFITLFLITTYLAEIRSRLYNSHQRRQPLLILGYLLILLIVNALLIYFLSQYSSIKPLQNTHKLIQANYRFLAHLQSPDTIMIWFYSWWICGAVLPFSFILPYINKQHSIVILLASLILPCGLWLISLSWTPHLTTLFQQPHTLHNIIITGTAVFAAGWGMLLIAPRSHMACLWFGYFTKPIQKTRAIPAQPLIMKVVLIWFLIWVFNVGSLVLLGIAGCLTLYVLSVLAYKTKMPSH